MQYIVVGLGNPGGEYEHTRHNAGRNVVERFVKAAELGDFEEDKKRKLSLVKGKVGKHTVVCVLPNTFMNNSGKAVTPFIKNLKDAERTIVVYDDLDLGMGTVRVSFDRGAGGHRGLLSVEKSLRTRKFIRVRIGVSPVTPSGKVKKPHGEEAVVKCILGKYGEKDGEIFKKVFKKGSEAIALLVEHGREQGTMEVNSK